MRGTNSVPVILTARDEQLFQFLVDARVCDREQIKAVAGFESTNRANARLLRLVRSGVLKRFFIATRSGGVKALYCLSPRTARRLSAPAAPIQRASDAVLIADAFITHQLAVNDIHIDFRCKCPAKFGVLSIKWLCPKESLSPTVRVIPDGYVEVNRATECLAMFVEVDLGTESLSIWKSKIQGYIRLAASGEFQQLFGHSRFRVLVVVPSERRQANVRKTVLTYTRKLFWFATLNDINSRGLFDPIWLRPDGDDRLPLL